MEPQVLMLFPHIELESLRNMFFWMTYKRAPHGSGTNLTREDVLGMEMSELTWHWEQLWDTWEKEAKAAKRG